MVAIQRVDRFGRDGMTFEALDRGPIDGPVVVLVHGWPQDVRCWESVSNLLNEAGFRTVVPALRGDTTETAPRSRWAYRKAHLWRDLAAVVDAVDRPVHMVGHDWGGTSAWLVATRRPKQLLSVASIAGPHLPAFGSAIFRSRQLFSASHMAVLQIPWLWDIALGRERVAYRLLRWSGQTRDSAARDARRLQDRAVRRAGVNFYRSLIADIGEMGGGRTSLPVLQVRGTDDPFITGAAISFARQYATGSYSEIELPNVGHWIPDRAPHELVAALIHHFHAAAGVRHNQENPHLTGAAHRNSTPSG